jgi:RHS repeat-associated protein
MLMPGRGGVLGANGLWQQTGTESGLPADPTYDIRTGNEPLEYKATQSITFLPGFESGDVNDTFEAYITTGNSGGSGGSGGGNGYGLYAEGGYRYGFNGKENDNEVKGVEGSQQDYGMRIYDPRMGRFLSVDPLTKDYPELTPYQFASNSPLAAIDLDGLEGLVATGMPLGKSGTSHGMIVSTKTAEEIKKRTIVTAFKAGFSHYIPKELIEHYSYGNGSLFKLNEQRMKDINPLQIGVQGFIEKDNKQFLDVLGKLGKGESVELKDWRVLNGSLTSGGLGGFTTIFNGILRKDTENNDKWSFSGTMEFYDNWNFKSHDEAVKAGEKDYRAAVGDEVTTFARKYLPGKPFDITSEKVSVKQTSNESHVDWFKGFVPQTVPNRVYQKPDLKKGVKKDAKM